MRFHTIYAITAENILISSKLNSRKNPIYENFGHLNQCSLKSFILNRSLKFNSSTTGIISYRYYSLIITCFIIDSDLWAMTVTATGSNRARYNRVQLNEPSAVITSSPPLMTESSSERAAATDANTVSASDNETGNNCNRDNNANEEMNSNSPKNRSEPDTKTPLIEKNVEHEKDEFVVIILDGLHRRFRVPASPDWTVSEFKNAGASVHQVTPPAQRLIFMGKMLQDELTLRSCGIIKTESIVHLFPKPTMVITDSSTGNNTNSTTENNNGCSNDSSNDQNRESTTQSGDTSNTIENNSSSGAHVPQIVLDADEARRTSNMVLFTTSEMFEASHRIKLFSFFLLFISTMELLTLLSIILGASVPNPPYMEDDAYSPGDPTDGSNETGNNSLRSWRKSDYADLFISTCGFYVATLGVRATTENTLISAKKYFYGLVFVGLLWISYSYYLDVLYSSNEIENKNDDSNGSNSNSEEDDDEPERNVYISALIAASLPIFIWGLCFFRAYEYQELVRQAELEAHERHDRLTRELERGSTEITDANTASSSNSTRSSIVISYGGNESVQQSNNSTSLISNGRSRLFGRSNASTNRPETIMDDRSLI